MLVYDITNEKSFDNIKNWIRNIEEHASADVEKMILGNKCDMNDRRQVIDRYEQIFVIEELRGLNESIIELNCSFSWYLIQVSKERGEELAIEYGIKFMETSAKASINVEEAFFTLARDIKAKMEKRLVSFCIHKFRPKWDMVF